MEITRLSAEEKWILNHVAVGSEKDVCCQQLLLGALAVEEPEGTDMFLGLYNKIEPLHKKQWEELQEVMPFEAVLSEDDLEVQAG